MRARTIVVAVLACLAAAAACMAADPNMGTWKLNEGKSKITPGTQKNTSVRYEMAGEKIKVVVDGVDGHGKPVHNEWTGMFDGKDYAVTGDPTADMRTYKRIDDHTLEVINKKDGKVTVSGRIVMAKDGKSRTLTLAGKDADGKEFKNTAIYDKE